MKKLFMAFIIGLALLLGGCAYNADQLFVVGAGIDASFDEVTVTLLWDSFLEEQQKPLSAAGSTLEEAVRVLESKAPGKLSFLRLEFLVLGGEYLKKQESAQELIADLDTFPGSTALFVSAAKAEELMQDIHALEAGRAGLFLSNVNRLRNNGLSDEFVRLSDYEESVVGGRFDVMLPVIASRKELDLAVFGQMETGGRDQEEISLARVGALALSEGRFGCYLNQTETSLLSILRNDATEAFLSFEKGRARNTVKVTRAKKSNKKLAFVPGALGQIEVWIGIEGVTDDYGLIKAKEALLNELYSALDKCKRAGSDVLGFLDLASKKYFRFQVYEELAGKWKQLYGGMEFEVSLEVVEKKP